MKDGARMTLTIRETVREKKEIGLERDEERPGAAGLINKSNNRETRTEASGGHKATSSQYF